MDTAISLIEILAIAMFSEANILHDDTAALAVGHVFMNRLEHGGFGSTIEEVSKGFHAIQYVERSIVPKKYFDLAKMVGPESKDITDGSLYIVSYQDTQTIAEMAGWPHHTSALRVMAQWRSKHRIVDGNMYALFAYKKFPVTILQDVMASVHEDSEDSDELLP